MIYYISFYFISIILLLLNEIYKSKIFIYILLIISFVFSALRYDAGYDYFSYLNLITYGKNFSFENIEFLNKYLIEISRYLSYPQAYYIITSFIYILFMSLGFYNLNKLDSITIVMFIFFIGSYLTSFDIIRQMVAVSIIFYATTNLIRKKYIISIFFSFVAYGFHRSSIAFIPIILFFYFFSQKKYGLLTYFSFFIISILSSNFIIEILEITGFYYSYISSGGNDTGEKTYLMLCFIVFALFVLSKTKEQTKFFWISFNLFFLGFLAYTIFLPFGYFATRISYFLFPWGFVAWSELISNSKNNKIPLKIFIYIFSTSIFFLTLYISSFATENPYLNYSFYFLR